MFTLSIRKWWNPGPTKARLEAGGKEGARMAAEFVLHRARSYCPIDTGELVASITIMSSQAGAVWHVVATAKHARFVEYGSMHGNTFIPPNPFMRRALMDGRRAYPSILKEAMVRAMPGQHLGASFKA